MTAAPLSIGSTVSLAKDDLAGLIAALRRRGYRTIGPRVADAAIVYDDLDDARGLPVGVIDQQDGGRYRLTESGTAGWFDYVVGPHSLKNYLFPPTETLYSIDRVAGHWETAAPPPPAAPLAVIGVRSCDLAALAIQDRVFLEGPYVDPAYQARRRNLFLVAVNCRRAAATCFCHSLNTGPQVRGGFDLALTELDESFVVDVGSQSAVELLDDVRWAPCSAAELAAAREASARLLAELERRSTTDPADSTRGTSAAADGPRPRQLDTHGIRELLLENLTHSRWREIGERCLACANCTLVCPTCFCSSVTDVSDLTGDHVRRERSWASCFTAEHSYMSSGVVRATTAARYRQWLTHKLASWIDQFGTSGCVGCGRCITWCPVGIDLTEEVAALRRESTA